MQCATFINKSEKKGSLRLARYIQWKFNNLIVGFKTCQVELYT